MSRFASTWRVLAITAVLVVVLLVLAIERYHPAVHRKLLTLLVLLVALPLGAALQRVDRLVFRSRRLRVLPAFVRLGLVAAGGVALAAVVAAIGYGLAELAAMGD